MKVYVGTSGWSYSWNPDHFQWYAENSKLNAVELNSSFYRFPFPTYIKSWLKRGKSFRWSIKVNKLITHQYKFNTRALAQWKNFQKLFEPMDKLIDFYLFQAPPSFTSENVNTLKRFILKTNLKERFAFEPRNDSWFDEKFYKIARKLKITWVSMDSPSFPRDIINTNGTVYLRMHGRTSWYSHDYSTKELKEIAKKIKQTKPKKVYIFFNNDHAMLSNAQKMMKILK